MITIDAFRTLALSFPGVIEHPHFDRAAFKVAGKKIFTTLHERSHTANVLLTVEDQAVFFEYNPEAIYPVPNKFGLQGWTTFELDKLSKEMVAEAMFTAHKNLLEAKTKKK
jgi:hypothetical protein